MKTILSRRAWLGLVACAVIAGCGSQPRLLDQYSELQLREIVESSEGLQLELRLSNFGEKAFDVAQVEFTLAIEGQPPIRQTHVMELNVSGWGTEPLSFKVRGARLADVGRATQLRYELTGVISRKGFRGSIPIRHAGVLSPVPGVRGAWR
jgi:hypothetical protein